MNITILRPVKEFLNGLDNFSRADSQHLIELLELYGHSLSMPYAKPIGRGLWELRRAGRPQIRILYGFCKESAVCVLALKKQREALREHDIALARRRLGDYCA